MDRFQKCFLVTVGLLVFLADPGFGFGIIEGPSNFTALVGTEARFNCTVSEGWQILIWLFEGQPVLSVTYPGKAIITDKAYGQQGYNKSTEFTSELIIHNIQRNNSGKIECNLQSTSASQYAFLSVQVNGSLTIKDHNLAVRENQTIEIVCEAVGWDPAPHITWMLNNMSVDNSNYITNQSQGSNGLYDEESVLTLTPVTNSTVTCLAAILALSKPQSATMTLVVYPPPKSDTNEDGHTRTIILAVVLSIVGFILLLLIILLIVCCCKRRKESNYQKEIQKVSVKKKARDQNLETTWDSGNENYGYAPEELTSTNQAPRGVTPFSLDDSGLGQDSAVGPASEISSCFSNSSQSLQRTFPTPPPHQHSQKHTLQQSRRAPQQQSRIISSKIHKPPVHWPHRRKLNPEAKHSNVQRYSRRKVYFHRWQSSGQHTRTKKPAHQPKKSETQDPQLRTQHIGRQHKYPKMQQKKSQHPQSWTEPQHHKAQTSQVSYDGNYGRVLPSRVAPYPINPRKIRNVTHV